MAQKFRLRYLITEVWLRCQEILCVIWGGHIGPRTDFPPRTLPFPFRHHFTNAPYSFIPFIYYGPSTSMPIKHVRKHTVLQRTY